MGLYHLQWCRSHEVELRPNLVAHSIHNRAHKWLSPETYDCELCALTHNSFAEVTAWKNFRQSGEIQMHFYHKNEFEKAFRSKWLPKYDFPIILIEADRGLEVFIAADELKKLETVEGLIAAVEEKWQYFD